MSGGVQDEHDQPLADINVTPLVDVMLVLLVIFILLAPMFSQAFRVDLPTAEAPPSAEPTVVDISLLSNGELKLDSESINDQLLVAELKHRFDHAPELVVRLNVDKNVHYQEVAQLMALVKSAGISRLAFATQTN